MGLSKRQIIKYIKLINCTLRRYRLDNIPITSFDLHFGIKNHKSVSLANKWVQAVASRSCLKELYLTLYVEKSSHTLPDELFSGENLDTVSVIAKRVTVNNSLSISNNHVTNCVNLRVLELIDVTISDEALLRLLSTCILLEKINLAYCNGLKTIKMKNLHYLRELKITPSIGYGTRTLEINDVPSLHLFNYTLRWNPLSFNMDSLESVRELMLDVVIKNDAYSEIISKFPSLKSLTLEIIGCDVNIVDISCVSLKRLNIHLWVDVEIEIKVSAPKLNNFHYEGESVPGLVFSSIAPNQIELTLKLMNPIYHTFFFKMREALNLSSKFNITIHSFGSDFIVPFVIVDVRRIVPIPATNVQKLTFEGYSDKSLWEHPLLFHAFFSICQPTYISSSLVERSSRMLIARRMIGKASKEYWPDLKKVDLHNLLDGKWETLTSSWINLLDGLLCLNRHFVKFKLTWCSLQKLPSPAFCEVLIFTLASKTINQFLLLINGPGQ